MRVMKSALAAALIAGSFSAPVAFAQEQQAGNEASTNAEATFQQLIEKCDDIEALTLRARIRLQIPRATPETAAEAQKLLDEGLAQCGAGELQTAKATLEQALAVGQEGVTANFGQDASPELATPEPSAESAGDEEGGSNMLYLLLGAVIVGVLGVGYMAMRK